VPGFVPGKGEHARSQAVVRAGLFQELLFCALVLRFRLSQLELLLSKQIKREDCMPPSKKRGRLKDIWDWLFRDLCEIFSKSKTKNQEIVRLLKYYVKFESNIFKKIEDRFLKNYRGKENQKYVSTLRVKIGRARKRKCPESSLKFDMIRLYKSNCVEEYTSPHLAHLNKHK
jgi:hypothetical protein